jgi:prepilin-type N-terminal cleavage/methylation domain-containing protein
MIKKGNSLLEILIAISLFSIFILGAITLEAARIRFKAYNKKKENYILCMEAVKVSIMNDIPYERINALYNDQKRYIKLKGISIGSFENSNIDSLFEANIDKNSSYLEIVVTPIADRKPVVITMDGHIIEGNTNEVIKCIFYKGSYH